MTPRPSETLQGHTRLLKCALVIEDARAYWALWPHTPQITPKEAFETYAFGARSLPRTTTLLANFRARFAAFPDAIATLSRWPDMSPETRALICHWHLQLADPNYREFTGEFLAQRRDHGRPTLTRDRAITWVNDHSPARWTLTTRIHLASKLMSAAFSAGILGRNRDPRPIVAPRVPDAALAYLLYLLRGITFEGTLLDNPYLISVGLTGPHLERRLADLPSVRFQRQGDLHTFTWAHPTLTEWADATLAPPMATPPMTAPGAPTQATHP